MFLCKKGYYSSFEEARRDFIDPTGKYYIERNFYDVEFIINLIINSGGIPVLAHPRRLEQKGDELVSYISYLKNIGIVGIETNYAYNSKEETTFYKSIAKKYNLLQTAGSDWHCDSDLDMGITLSNEQDIVNSLINYKK